VPWQRREWLEQVFFANSATLTITAGNLTS
jgi:hypothetical protein